MKNIVIDLINLDHCYISTEKNSVYYNNEQRRLGNIRPYINNNVINISENDKYELITQTNNPTDFPYESWLAVYVKKYIEYANYEKGDKIVFVIPKSFNKNILSIVMSILKLKFYYVYDYFGAVYLMSYHKVNKAILIPNEYDTTIVYVINNSIVGLKTIDYGSNYIKIVIKNYFKDYNISLTDAWNIYKALQVNSTINISQIVMSIEEEVIISRDILNELLYYYYYEIISAIPNTFTIAPFRWIGRDVVMNDHYNMLTDYNIDESICIGVQNYIIDGGEIYKVKELEIDLTKNDFYIELTKNSFEIEYYNLINLIKLTNKFNSLANDIDHFFIKNNIEPIDIELTKMSLKNCIKYLYKCNAPSILIHKIYQLFWNI